MPLTFHIRGIFSFIFDSCLWYSMLHTDAMSPVFCLEGVLLG